ncbi:MAG: Ig-like domain-containing protein, partial [Candidatus Binatus sp.]
MRYMRANGFELLAGSKNRLTLTMRGTRAQAERLFQVRIQEYSVKDKKFFANDTDPAMPSELAAHLLTVAGLSDLATPHKDKSISANHVGQALPPELATHLQAVAGLANQERPQPDDQLIGALEGPIICALGSLACFRAPQYVPPPPTATIFTKCLSAFRSMQAGNFSGLQALVSLQCPGPGSAAIFKGRPIANPDVSIPFTGAGQKIGLVEFDTFQTSDVSDYLDLIGASSSQISQLSEKNVDGGATPGANQAEVLLDIDTVMTIATGADVVVYDAPFNGTGSFQALFNQMVDDKVTVISNSWAYCENQTTLADVQSIDSIFQSAEAAGITIFNGSGDNGSTCLDGAANTVSVPADSPNATAVGGSSLITGKGFTYQSETWWNGTSDTPPTGQGGFGVSKFFGVPTYQTGLATGGRSVPDVVENADPAVGVMICQASNGGCPNGFLYGGTSYSAPQWAGFVAVLNQGLGSNLGTLNPMLYAHPGTFHDAASMGSDFAHVGLGSPNLDALFLALSGASAGPVSASVSTVTPYIPVASSLNISGPGGVPADGTTAGTVVVQLFDANGNSIVGKNVSLSATDGSPTITPPSAVTDAYGDVTFTLTDSTVETPTLTADDTTDGVKVSTTPTLPFITPPAASASIVASLSSVANDGTSDSVITVTLKDSNGHATPGKMVTLSQTGSSVITTPSPQVTGADGKIGFKVTDLAMESVTYTAVDVTDGNLPVPGSAVVDFSGDPSNACTSPPPVAAPGFVVTPYATGFTVQSLTTGGGQQVDFNCEGATGIAFDSSGNLYVNEFTTGNIYKFPPGGGVAGPSTKLNSTSLGQTLSGLAFDSSGNLFASLDVSSADSTTGSILQLNPSTGAITRTISSTEICPTAISIDPLSGDLFTDDTCTESYANDSVWRVSDPGGASPSTSVYTTLSPGPNATLAFAPGGTIYAWTYTGSEVNVAEISGTNGPTTPTVTTLPGLQLANLGLLAGGTGAGTYLIGTPFVDGATVGINEVDLTSSPPTLATALTTKAGANFLTIGTDGCIYGSQGPTVFRITDTAGDCTYASALSSPSIALTPTSVSPNPVQGTSQTFNASVHYATPPAGTQVIFGVAGANPLTRQVTLNADGQASFSYTAAHPGLDTITASTTVSGTVLVSNQAVVTWAAGSDTTFVSINQSPKGAVPGQMVNLIASLTDVSQNPATAVSGQTIDFSVGGQNCNGPTNAQGIATCQLTASGAGMETLTASFAGTGDLLASNASAGFNVLVTAATPTATATRTATPTATPTPVIGKLKVSPKTINFGDVEVGSNKTKDVKVTNAGKVKKKKVP